MGSSYNPRNFLRLNTISANIP